MVLVGDEDAHLRVALDVPLHPVSAGEEAVLHRTGAAGAGQVVGQRLFGCCCHIGLGLGAAGSRPRMDPPIIEHLRHMGRAAHLLDEPEEEVVVLTAIALWPLAAHGIPQGLLEHGQMADVVAAEQVIRRIVRLEVCYDGPLDALGEERFIAVKEAIRFPPLPQLQDGLAHRVHRVGRQNVVVVRKGQIVPGGKGSGSIGVRRNALVFDLFVYDTLILCLIFLHDPFYGIVFRVGRIGKAELAVGSRLIHKRIQKFPQVWFRRIVQRGQDRDGGQPAGVRRLPGQFGPLGFQHLFRGQIPGLFAEAPALDEAGPPRQHGTEALIFRQLDSITRQLLGAFQSYIHLMPRRAGSPCKRHRPSWCRRSSSGGRGSAMPPCCTSARSARWSGTPE